ncbi:unnamed protein product [Rodentolepis nana]|uniref:Actin-related protein 10 n=1 Tax=Rodentolepis nana TaxID=102285 RepID=A0A0R3T357_RODNA|nr:unnamed protein product [Rodentolepis nana]
MALKYFFNELVNGGVNLTQKEIDCFGPYIYQKAAFIENQDSKCGGVVIDLTRYTPYPLDKQICVPAELRRKASDSLLRSENSIEHDGELPPFNQLLRAAILSCDLDLRSSICSNVLIIGEFAEIEGFRERVQEEIRMIVPGSRPNVQVAPTPTECVFEGACLLTALLQGPYAPKCPWFRFVDDLDWFNMCQDANATNGATDTRLLSRLNRDCIFHQRGSKLVRFGVNSLFEEMIIHEKLGTPVSEGCDWNVGENSQLSAQPAIPFWIRSPSMMEFTEIEASIAQKNSAYSHLYIIRL